MSIQSWTTPTEKSMPRCLRRERGNPHWKTLDSWVKLIGTTILEQCSRPHLPNLKVMLGRMEFDGVLVGTPNYQIKFSTKFSGYTVCLDVTLIHPLCRTVSMYMYAAGNWPVCSLWARIHVFGCHCGVTTHPICLNTHHIHPPGLLHCGLCVGGDGLILCRHTDLLVPEYEYHSKTMSMLTKNHAD